MKFSILTLFPNFFTSPLQESILKRAIEKKQIDVNIVNIRDFSENKNKSVDDKPFGGGAGMLMQAEPIAKAVESVKYHLNNTDNQKYEIIFFTPSAPELTQKDSYELANSNTHKIFLCGHYEGIDERVLDMYVDKSFSVGKTVLTGGEIPALLCLDSIVRLLPSVISKEKSHERETFSVELYEKGEYPQFTRPENWRGKKVPKVLLSGNEALIKKYQFENLKNCTDLEKQIILFREKYKNIKIRLKKYARNKQESEDLKNNNFEYIKFIDFKSQKLKYLNILEFAILDKNLEVFGIKNIKLLDLNNLTNNLEKQIFQQIFQQIIG